jgi:hypothetical protein
MTLERKSLKKKIYTEAEIKNWLNTSEKIKADITQGETGEAFAVYFYPSGSIAKQDLKKIVGHIAKLMDKDKPFARISSIRLEIKGNKTAIRIGWST